MIDTPVPASSRYVLQLEETITEQQAEITRFRDIESEMLMIGVERAKDQFKGMINREHVEY